MWESWTIGQVGDTLASRRFTRDSVCCVLLCLLQVVLTSWPKLPPSPRGRSKASSSVRVPAGYRYIAPPSPPPRPSSLPRTRQSHYYQRKDTLHLPSHPKIFARSRQHMCDKERITVDAEALERMLLTVSEKIKSSGRTTTPCEPHAGSNTQEGHTTREGTVCPGRKGHERAFSQPTELALLGKGTSTPTHRSQQKGSQHQEEPAGSSGRAEDQNNAGLISSAINITTTTRSQAEAVAAVSSNLPGAGTTAPSAASGL